MLTYVSSIWFSSRNQTSCWSNTVTNCWKKMLAPSGSSYDMSDLNRNKTTFLGFRKGGWLIKGRNNLFLISLVRIFGTQLLMMYASVFPVGENPLLQVPSNPCALAWSVKGLTDGFSLSVGRFLLPHVHPASNLPVNHIKDFRLHNKLLQESSWCFRHYGLTLHSANS